MLAERVAHCCPYCLGSEVEVIETKRYKRIEHQPAYDYTRRRYRCDTCGRRFTRYETDHKPMTTPKHYM